MEKMDKKEILDTILPCIKAKDWIGRGQAFCHPLIHDSSDDTNPWVGYGFDAPHSFQFLNAQEAEEHGWSPDPSSELIQSAIQNLRKRNPVFKLIKVDIKTHTQNVVSCKDDHFSAENILNREFMLEAHHALGTNEIVVGIPRRGLLVSTAKDKSDKFLWHFGMMVSEQYYKMISAQISPALVLVKSGVPVGIERGDYEKAAQIIVEAESKDTKKKKNCEVSSMLLKDKGSGETLAVISAGGIDFDQITSQVITNYMQAIQEAQNHKEFSGRVEVWVEDKITPNNDRARMFISDIKMHLESIAREQDFEGLLGMPIRVSVQRKSLFTDGEENKNE